jgi:predicted nucleic acid-binding protein
MKANLYVETTIVSYLAARPSRDTIVAAHQQITRDWWRLRRKRFALYCSQLVVREVGAGDRTAAAHRLALLRALPLLEINALATEVARALLDVGAIPKKATEDALHVALAAAHGMEYLLTWNCKHIANAEIRAAVAAVCHANGCEAPVICTPEELMGA